MQPDLARRLPLLRSMARDFERDGSLRPATARAMWTGYLLHAALTAWALGRRTGAPTRSRRTARAVGSAVTLAGVGLCVAGMGRFSGASQVTGTSVQPLTTGGVYRFSRNPQYVGYVAALAGAAVLRRSPSALAASAVAAGVYAAWVPVEEAHLAETYGAEYAGYRGSTARWWGRPRVGPVSSAASPGSASRSTPRPG